MKIALLGNMNGANFSLMRYLYDLGYETHLFLFKNDGKQNNSHFHWTADTFEEEKWINKITSTKLINSQIQIISAHNFFYFIFYFIYICLKCIRHKSSEWFNPGAYNVKKELKKITKNYDLIISNGNSPGLFNHSEIPLSIFYPYSTGVEYVNCSITNNLLSHESRIIKLLVSEAKRKQIKGLKNVCEIYNAEMGLTYRTLQQLNLQQKPLPIPAYYSTEAFKKPSIYFKPIHEEFYKKELIIIMHSRHVWKKPEMINNDEFYQKESKNNHWLIHAFSSLLKARPNLNAGLVMVEYGQDVDISKELCAKLNIEENVLWLPKMKLKYMKEHVKQATLIVGEFTLIKNIIWGSTGWESFANGKLFMNYFSFKENEFQKLTGLEEPHILKVKKAEDVFEHLKWVSNNIELCVKLGEKNRLWFNKNNGIELVKKWIDLYSAKC